MQSYGGRDQAISLYYDKLLNAGAVDEEFALYGFMYLENHEPGFYITGQEQKVFNFLMHYEQQGIYCTPVLQKNYWTKVAKGERQKIKRQYQFDMVRTLESMYSKNFFSGVEKLGQTMPADTALEVLSHWKDEMDVSYDMDLIHLYEVTVAMAVQMRLLTIYTAEKFIKWAHELENQLKMDELQQEGDVHTYAGLAYLDDDGKNIRYLQFGKHYTAWQKRQQLMMEGKIVSPVFDKKMYFSATDFRIIQKKKQEFEGCMKEKMGEWYFEYMKTLYNLPSVADKDFYRYMMNKIEENGTQHEKTAFQLYGAQLRML